MFRRPPKGACLAERVSESLRATKSGVGSCKPTGAVTTDHDSARVFADVVVLPNPWHEFGGEKVGELRIGNEIYQTPARNIFNKYRHGRGNLGSGNEVVQRRHRRLIFRQVFAVKHN